MYVILVTSRVTSLLLDGTTEYSEGISVVGPFETAQNAVVYQLKHFTNNPAILSSEIEQVLAPKEKV